MSDFLISLGKKYTGQDLLRLVKKPYRELAPEGRSFDFPWGGMAVLEDRLANNNNIIEKDGVVVTWLGDLVTQMSAEFVAALTNRIGQMRNRRTDETISLESDEVFEALNGAFAILVADKHGFSIVTDPGNFVQVYMGTGRAGSPVSFGTHSDLVAALPSESPRLDAVSAAELLNCGAPSFPHTMYEDVKELNPGRLYGLNFEEPRRSVKSITYWKPAPAIRAGYNVDELAQELAGGLLQAVRDRCIGRKVGVALSGGSDSRLIMAAVPDSVDCIGLTFCDHLNRETRTAARVSKSYNRHWTPLYRDRESLANSIIPSVRSAGCEAMWTHAHGMTLVQEISNLGLDTLLGGMEMDVYLKAWFASDWACRKRMRGLLPDKYVRVPHENIPSISDFEKHVHTQKVTGRMYLRRQHARAENLDPTRSSIPDWVTRYPFALDAVKIATSTSAQDTLAAESPLANQASSYVSANPHKPEVACGMRSIIGWATERRFLPLRLVALDRRLLDFSYKCPLELKLGGKVFLKAAMGIYGPGAKIPSANDGVRPGSGHLWRLAQRAVRKLQDRATAVLEKLGKEPKIQHSWHDYQKYWRESKKLDELRDEYGANLDQLDGVLFKQSGRALLESRDTHWQYGFCLIQLAVWLGMIEHYRTHRNESKTEG